MVTSIKGFQGLREPATPSVQNTTEANQKALQNAKVNVEQKDNITLSAKQDESTQQRSSSTLVDVNNVSSALQVAGNALNQIKDLRETQLEYAKEAESISDPTRQSELNTEIQSLQTEIERVFDDATFNGDNVLEGETFIIESDEFAIRNAFSIADFSAFREDPSVDVTDQSSAETAVDTLEEEVSSVRVAANGASAAFSKAQGELSGVLQTIRNGGGNNDADPLNESDATELANKVATEVIEAGSRPEPVRRLVDSLYTFSAERASILLEEETALTREAPRPAGDEGSSRIVQEQADESPRRTITGDLREAK